MLITMSTGTEVRTGARVIFGQKARKAEGSANWKVAQPKTPKL